MDFLINGNGIISEAHGKGRKGRKDKRGGRKWERTRERENETLSKKDEGKK